MHNLATFKVCTSVSFGVLGNNVMTFYHRWYSDLAMKNRAFTAIILDASCDQFDRQCSICKPKHLKFMRENSRFGCSVSFFALTVCFVVVRVLSTFSTNYFVLFLVENCYQKGDMSLV